MNAAAMGSISVDGRRLLVLVTLLAGVSTLMELVAIVLHRNSNRKRRKTGQHSAAHLSMGDFDSSRCGWARALQNHVLCVSLLTNFETPQPVREINCPWYCKPRATEWFYLFVEWSPNQDPERFKQFLRISPNLFRQVCEIVRPDMSTSPPHQFLCLPNRQLVVERQVALAIRRLATGDQILGIAELFGVSKATTVRVIWKFIQSFSTRARSFLTWPTGPAMDKVKADFMQRWGFPQCCGAIDVTHFPIELPFGENSTAYYDWKHKLSVTMQAVVDVQCRFTDVLVGCPGSIQDSRLLRTSSLFQNVVYDGSKLHGPEVGMPGGHQMREYLLGDAGYPLYSWLIVPFPRNQSQARDDWNHQHSSARICVERAFGRLKGTWRILSRIILRPKIDRLAPTILACVLLHNMIIDSGEELPAAVWADVHPHPHGYGSVQRPTRSFFYGGVQARNALMRATNAHQHTDT